MTHRYMPRHGHKGINSLTGLAATVMTIFAAGTVQAEPFEMMVHPKEVNGTRNVEAGDYDEAIRRLMTRLGGSGQARSLRVPVVIDLCVAHTMNGDVDAATRFCNEAVETGWSAGLAYNNRGVLRIAKGQYEAARHDFENALERSGADAVARRNLQRTTVRIAQIREQNRTKSIATAGLRQVSER